MLKYEYTKNHKAKGLIKSVGGHIVEINIGDVVTMKKAHPCGCFDFEIVRVGMDFKIKCRKCGHIIMMPREKAEKGIKKIINAEKE